MQGANSKPVREKGVRNRLRLKNSGVGGEGNGGQEIPRPYLVCSVVQSQDVAILSNRAGHVE